MNIHRHTPQRVALGALTLALGCAPVDGELDTVTQALTGPAPTPPTTQAISGALGTNVWSSGTNTNRWSDIALADVNGDGLADLCGVYADSWGCALRTASTVFDGFVEARVVRTFSRSTVRLADLDGDGRADVCGRDTVGYRCLLSRRLAGGDAFVPAVTPAGAPLTYVTDMRNANGWARPEYESTVMIGRLEGNGGGLDVCARGSAGVICHFNLGATSPMVRGPTITAFGDVNGWNRPEYFRTLAMADVNGDGRMDVCGRGIGGVWCAVYDHTRRDFSPATLWTTQFGDADGWADPRYFTSLRFGDVNGDRVDDVCGRGGAGVYCGISDGRGAFLASRNLAVPGLSDAAGFSSANFPTTMALVDFDQDGRRDVCMVGPFTGVNSSGVPVVRSELFCARSRSIILSFDPVARRTDQSGIADTVASGAIRPASRGFCWVDAIGVDVRCTNAW